MAEYRVTYWRDIPSMVSARDGEGRTAKVELPSAFQERIDEEAMRLGLAGSDAYLEEWRHGDWLPQEGDPAEVAAAVAARLEVEHA